MVFSTYIPITLVNQDCANWNAIIEQIKVQMPAAIAPASPVYSSWNIEVSKYAESWNMKIHSAQLYGIDQN